MRDVHAQRECVRARFLGYRRAIGAAGRKAASPGGINTDVADLYTLVHRRAGPLATFLTLFEAKHELYEVLRDEPEWEGDVWVEPFEFVVAETRTSR